MTGHYARPVKALDSTTVVKAPGESGIIRSTCGGFLPEGLAKGPLDGP
jgi:hypothetical protein